MREVKMQEKNVKSGWNEALVDAKRKHAEGRKYVARMRAVIRTIERKIADKEAFPGDKSTA